MRLQLNRGAPWIAVFIAGSLSATAAVLPEDRADALYHYYNGGGVEVNGPALLVRKSLAEKMSLTASYYVDTVSSASIDVLTTASPFKEKRTEYRGGVDYLEDNSTVSFSWSRSDEPDYKAGSVSLNTSHELFGGMATVSLGYTQGKDQVFKTGSAFKDKVDRQQYRIGVSHVLTKSLIASVNYEAIAEEGFLNSPYRSARILDAYTPERYPRTRNSHALALRGILALGESGGKPTSSLTAATRLYDDSWNIKAHEIELSYQRYLRDQWIGELSLRHYSQTAASFYNDNFSAEFEFMARDKELSTFRSYSFGVKATKRLCHGASGKWRCELGVALTHMSFRYEDFTDVNSGAPFGFNASMADVLLSLWF